ncbi:MAG: monovalent cation/H(+) antiporter subunit G [Clostridiales bacterium]|nr:monovalent cation/H(+) antiporter subunit G [Clostridiales bacterium]
MNIAGIILLIAGGFFYAVGGLGLVRMPDIYNRAQAATKATTLGTIFTLIGVGFYQPSWFLKLIAIILFILLTNPVSSSTLIRSAYKNGVKPTEKTSVDELKEYYEKEEK